MKLLKISPMWSKVCKPVIFLLAIGLFVALFPVHSLAQSPSITNVLNGDGGVDYTGAIGQDVKINGSNFGSSQGTSTVTFNGTAATVTTWSATALYTTVPSGATSGNLIVTVGGVASNTKSFTVLTGPNIVTLRNNVTNVDDFTGAIGQTLKIMGGGFGASQGSSTITFNGTASTVTTWSADALYTAVPDGATSGNVVVTVGGVSSNTASFTVLAGPKILDVRRNNVSVTSGTVGDSLKIMGGGFGASQGSSTVKFNGTTATVTNWGEAALYTTLPSGATTGNLVVTVSGTASNSYSFTVGPVVSGVTPTTGGAGTVVQISGSNFGSSQGSSTVNINGTSVGTASTWQNTNIAFTMPAGLSSGNLIVTANSLSSSATSFTVTTTPTVYTVTPTTAGAGDVIQITGCNFGSSQGSNTVKINGTSVGTTSTWQQGYISFTMPTGLSSGNLVVGVGGVSSNTTSLTVTQPSITSISPTSGAPGLHVTITGSYFGSSPGSVTFYNSQNASIYSWSSSQIVAIVPAGVTTGNVFASVSGVQTNSATFTTVTPPTISTSVFPAPNGSGWQNQNVTVTYTCTPGGLAISSCSSPQTVSSEGTSLLASGSATDLNGDVANASVTLNIDKTQPTLTISSPADGSSTSSSNVTVSGTLSDTLSGVSGVTCNGTATTLSSGTFSCNISLSVGVNLIMIRGTDIAGNVAGANFHVTETGSLPAATSLLVAPTGVNMVVGDTQQFSVVDDQGHPRTDATWSVDYSSIGTIDSSSSPTLTAIATGTVTLTATVGSGTASTAVTVVSGTSLTAGTIRWSAPSVSGYTNYGFIQAQPIDDSGPDVIDTQRGSSGQFLARAFTNDGRHLWQYSSDDIEQGMVASPDGGVITELNNPTTGEYLAKLDRVTGKQQWQFPLNTTSITGLRPWAMGGDGTMYLLEPQYVNYEISYTNILALDGATGAVRFRIPVPNSTSQLVYIGGCVPGVSGYPEYSSSAPTALVGPPIIDVDGTLVIQFGVENTTYNAAASSPGGYCDDTTINYDSQLQIWRIQADGTYTTTIVKDLANTVDCGTLSSFFCTHYTTIPGQIIPDGQGGLLASWKYHNYGRSTTPPFNEFPDVFHGSDVASSGISDHAISALQPANGYYSYLPLVLGCSSVAFGSDGRHVVAFDLSSGTTNWTYTPSSYSGGVRILTSNATCGLAAKVTDAYNVDTVVRIDSSGQPTLDGWSTSAIDYSIGTEWLGLPASGGSTSAYFAPPVQLNPAAWFMPGQPQARPAVTVSSFSQAGANQTTITNLVQEIITDLQNSSFAGSTSCKNWVQSTGNTMSTLQDILNGDPTHDTAVGWGHGVVNKAGRIAYETGAITPVPVGLPVGVVTAVNDVSGFFYESPNGTAMFWGIQLYPGNHTRARATMLLHEIGHLFALPDKDGTPFLSDLTLPAAGKHNDQTVDYYCRQFIEALP